MAGDAGDAQQVYVGTDLGVFRGAPSGAVWQWVPYNEGLPLADVRDLVVNRVSGLLLAATYGRGAWAVQTR